jgi:hypothetical protein
MTRAIAKVDGAIIQKPGYSNIDRVIMQKLRYYNIAEPSSKSQDTGAHPSPYNLQSITLGSHPSAALAETNQRKLQEREPVSVMGTGYP